MCEYAKSSLSGTNEENIMNKDAKMLQGLIIVLCTLLINTTGHAFVIWGIDWNWLGGNPVSVGMKVNPNCTDATAPNELATLQSAMNTWSNAGANFAFYYAGATSVTNYTNNGQNDMCWNPSGGGGALATTTAWYQPGTSNMTQCDVVFWDGGITWSTTTPSYFQYDVESVALHELGHCLGLDHSQYNWAVMWYAIGGGEVQRTLSSDDIAGAIYIYGNYGGPSLSVSISPTGSVYLPATGGTIPYDLEVHNLTSNTVWFDGWSEFEEFGGGYTQLVIMRSNMYISPSGTIARSLLLSVSGSVPGGTYEYYARVGDYPSTIIAEDNFQFFKSYISDGQPWVEETTVTGWEDPVIVTPFVPETFNVSQAYPNPFNPQTTIEFDLPETADITLSVYNLQGQKVVDLVTGTMEAGHYKVHWNAAGYPSGTYIYRFNSDLGQSVGKMVLMK